MAEKKRPGDAVPESGIYRVEHDPPHIGHQEVTCVYGDTFPSCKQCAGVTFMLVKAAHRASYYEWFQ